MMSFLCTHPEIVDSGSEKPQLLKTVNGAIDAAYPQDGVCG